jgi:hypothetical protein
VRIAINLVVQDGIVQHPALRYDSNSKPESRFTLVQTEKDWPLYLPCTAVGSAAERLASEIEDGQHIVITSAKLCYRKRATKAGEQSRMEILVWSIDRLTGVDHQTTSNSTSEEVACNSEAPEPVPGHKARNGRCPSIYKSLGSRLGWKLRRIER